MAFRAWFVIVILWTSFVPVVGAVQLKIATLAPDGSGWMNEVRRGADEIAERTDGRVKVRLYPGGAMGNEKAMLRKIRIGQLQGAMVVANALSSSSPDFQVYGLPLMFRSYDEVDHVRSIMDPILLKGLEDAGYVAFGIIEGGFAFIMSSKPTTSIADLSGRKAWIPEGDPIAKAILDAAGLSPVPLPLSDVLTGLQTGLVDTVAGPPVGAVALQWFTKARFFTDKPILYSYGSIVLSGKAFKKITAADQAVVREVFEQVSMTLNGRARADNESARKALVKQGVEIVTMSESEEQRWQKVAAEANRTVSASETVSPALVSQLEQLLAGYREQHGGL